MLKGLTMSDEDLVQTGFFTHDDGVQPDLGIDLNPGGHAPYTGKRTRKPVGRDDGRRAVSSLFDSAYDLKDRTKLVRLMDFMAENQRYSVFNMCIVNQQRPSASIIGTERYWQQRGRRLKPGATPCVIMKPNGPVGFVYDINDTVGHLFGGDEHLDPFIVGGYVAGSDYERFTDFVMQEKYFRLEEVDMAWNSAGRISGRQGNAHLDYRQGQTRPFHIRISSRLDTRQKSMTLAHELAHAYLGHLGQLPGCWWPSRQNLSTAIEEFEAEAAAWLVARRAGLEPRSADYLVGFASDYVWEHIDMEAIIRTANRIESLKFPIAQNPTLL